MPQVVSHVCAEGWVCGAHPDLPYPHGDCAGPGVPCEVCNPDGERKPTRDVIIASTRDVVLTLACFTFAITGRNGELLALAALCLEARYVSLRLPGIDRLSRRHATPAEWREIDRLVAHGLTKEPMTSGPFHAVLAAGAEDRSVAWLHCLPVKAAVPTETVQALDAHLKQQTTELRLRLTVRQENRH